MAPVTHITQDTQDTQNTQYTQYKDSRNASHTTRPDPTPDEQNKDQHMESGQGFDGKGWSRYLYPDGSEYDGMWSDHHRHGSGRFTFSEDSSVDVLFYEGSWKHGLRHGWGTLMFRNGMQFEGSFHEDMIQGAGVSVYPDGSQYIGLFKDGFRDGFGIFISVEDGEYKGHWQNDKIHGKGIMWLPDGSRYQGEFKEGIKHGVGVHSSHLPGSSADSKKTVTYHEKWKKGKCLEKRRQTKRDWNLIQEAFGIIATPPRRSRTSDSSGRSSRADTKVKPEIVNPLEGRGEGVWVTTKGGYIYDLLQVQEI